MAESLPARVRSAIDQRPSRERWLGMAALVVVAIVLWNFLVLMPQEAREERAVASHDRAQSQLAELLERERELRDRLDDDPDAELDRRIARLEERLEETEAALDAQLRQFVTPREMTQVLRRLLDEHEGLELVRLETGAPREVFAEDEVQIFRHPVALEFTGGFGTTYRYLRRLESVSEELGWDRLDYRVADNGEGRIELRVHTLSTSRPTLGL